MAIPRTALLTALIMSMGISLVMSFVFTALGTGFSPGFLIRWMGGFGLGSLIAFSTSLLLGPLAAKAAGKLSGDGPQ